MTKSEQARADALADAETLRRNARLPGHGLTCYRALRACNEYAEWALVYGVDGGVEDFADCAADHWRLSARAAFRAVPGLRGE